MNKSHQIQIDNKPETVLCYSYIERSWLIMKSYSEGVKQQVIERYLSCEPSASILADTGIPKSTFYNWVQLILSYGGGI